jgi:hypothetical protein
MKHLTAIQYQTLLMELPNPLSILREGKVMIELNYLIDPNTKDKFLFGQKNQFIDNMSEFAKVETITFQIVSDFQLPYWEPKEAIIIEPVTDEKVNHTRYFK